MLILDLRSADKKDKATLSLLEVVVFNSTERSIVTSCKSPESLKNNDKQSEFSSGVIVCIIYSPSSVSGVGRIYINIGQN